MVGSTVRVLLATTLVAIKSKDSVSKASRGVRDSRALVERFFDSGIALGVTVGAPRRQCEATQKPTHVAKATVVCPACDVLAPPANTQRHMISNPSGSIR